MEVFEKLEEATWIFGVSFVLSFFLSFGLGANDVANSFATSVGSKVLTLKQACIIASFAEFSGSVLLGSRVADTIRKSIVDPAQFQDEPEIFMIGMLSAMISTTFWLFAATYFKLPVSATHSIVSAIIGFGLIAKGPEAVYWSKMTQIAISWVVSPLLAGFISCLIYLIIKFGILKRADPFIAGIRAVPIIYFATVAINVIPVTIQVFQMVEHYIGERNYADYVPLVASIGAGIGLGLIVGIFVAVVVVPRQREKILGEYTLLDNSKENDPLLINGETEDATQYGTTDKPLKAEDSSENIEAAKTEKLFSFLQILTATFGSFVHGSNDVSNAIGPLIAIYSVWLTGDTTRAAETPIWILAYGGIGIVIGLAIWGRRVIETMGSNLTEITPSRGFSIEIGSALTVLIASQAGIPVSTTHCKVGSVVSVGYASNDGTVSWKLFGKIVISWILTIPLAGGVGALAFYLLSFSV